MADVARLLERARFLVGLWIANVLWRVSETCRAVGNWFEDLATAQHPRSLRAHLDARPWQLP
jgi:hypothetical protein